VPLPAHIQVTPPKRGTVTRRSGDRRYVYKVVKAYRNDKGQPTNTRTMIGRLDEQSGMLIPNDAYWQEYGLETGPAAQLLPRPDAIRSVGAVYTILGVLNQLGVSAILRSALGGPRADLVLTLAAYMARCGNVMDGLADWCEESTPRGVVVSPGQASRLFASVTHAEKMAFFRAWVALQPVGSHLAYDVTSFSSYSEGINDLEWGHNRDGDKLPQINLGCYLNQSNALPVFYITYPGSIVDVAHLSSMTAHNQDLGIGDVVFIMDRGFASTKNLTHLRKHGIRHVIGTPVGLKAAKTAIAGVLDQIISMRTRLPGGVYAASVEGRFYGQSETLHVYYDPVLAERKRADVARQIENETRQLNQLDQLTRSQADSHRRYFTIDLRDDGSFTFEADLTKADAALEHAGVFTLLTDTAMTCAEALKAYRRKDSIEKAFDDIKNHQGMKRLRTHSDQTTDGKLFAAFIALIALSHIQQRLGPQMKKTSTSKKSILAELDKLKTVETASGLRLLNPATKTQRDILQALDLSEDELRTYATTDHTTADASDTTM